MSENYRIVGQAEPFEALSNRLLKELTHHYQWRARAYTLRHGPSNKRDAYIDVRDGGQILTPGRIRQLLAKAWRVQRIRWDTDERGVCIEAGNGYWLLTPANQKGRNAQAKV